MFQRTIAYCPGQPSRYFQSKDQLEEYSARLQNNTSRSIDNINQIDADSFANATYNAEDLADTFPGEEFIDLPDAEPDAFPQEGKFACTYFRLERHKSMGQIWTNYEAF